MTRISSLIEVDYLIGDRAVFHTTPAPGAEFHIDASGPFLYLYLEISGRTLNGFKISIGDQFDV